MPFLNYKLYKCLCLQAVFLFLSSDQPYIFSRTAVYVYLYRVKDGEGIQQQQQQNVI